MMTKRIRVGSRVRFLYPKHGKMNILRMVEGCCVQTGIGPNGRYYTVEESSGSHRNFSRSKIVAK